MEELDDVMTILAISIVADSRVANEEIEVFRKVVSKIKLSNLDIKLPSEDAAIAWLKLHRQDITSIVFGPKLTFEDRLNSLLDRLATHTDPEALIHALQMISIADGEIHDKETQLISFIKRRWQMN